MSILKVTQQLQLQTGISQMALARFIGVHQTLLSKYQNGECDLIGSERTSIITHNNIINVYTQII